MQNLQLYDYVILGGGLAGLTFALEAARRGKRVVVLESGERAGGLARTLVYGDYRFDVGGHRFHSRWPHITEWLLDLMDGEMLQVIRRSHIFLNGRYIDYPLQFPNALAAFSLPQGARVLASYIGAALRRDGSGQDDSFEDWVVRRFGHELYQVYFRPYTEKVWGMNCAELSAHWASQRIRLPNLAAAVRASLLRGTAPPGSLVSRFYYPVLGFGAITDKLVEKAQATDRATIHVNSRVIGLQNSEAGGWQVRYRQAGQEKTVTGQQIISTIPLGLLVEMLPAADKGLLKPADKLTYRSLACVFLAVDGPRISADTWTYFPDRHLVFGRTHEPPNWSRLMAPPGRTSLCIEVFCSVGDDVWQSPDDELIGRVLADLARLNLVARERVRQTWLLRVPEAYPVYRVGYEDQLRRARDYLARWSTLHLLGRTGSFQYLNADAVIKQALEMADAIVGPA